MINKNKIKSVLFITQDENTFLQIDNRTTPVVQSAEESLNTMGTSIFSLQKKLAQLKETNRFSNKVVETTKQTNEVHFAMERVTSELARLVMY